MSHSKDGVIELTNPMPSQSFMLEVKTFVMWNKWLLNPIYCILIVPCFLLQSMCDAPNFDKCVCAESHIGHILGRTRLY